MPGDLPFRHQIGFVSTRINGTDGVSLEIEKWAEVLERLGQETYYFAGASDRPAEVSMVVPEAHFKHPEIQAISESAFSGHRRDPQVTRRILQLKDHLKAGLVAFVERFGIDLLVVENALTIPVNIPLGLALTEFIAETGMHVIAHHHDFYWERKRFLVNCVWDYLDSAFPPRLPSVRHIVINSAAASQLSYRRGISSRIIPNVMDFDNPPAPPDPYTEHLRPDLGLAADELLFLQPTRVVHRKGIEHSIELVRRLGRKVRLVISHASGDEGYEYEQHLRNFAELLDVQASFESDVIGERRQILPDGRKVYALGDVYPFADLVTYPSVFEGFGNAFLEAVYYRRPILLNNYTIYAIDIKPRGFRAIEMDGFITDRTVAQVGELLEKPDLVEAMVEHNFRLARRYFSFAILERQLHALLQAFFGDEGDLA
ncbi:MAG: glycosyltransferase family 4 protein [Anaerolineales bacterium]|nr:glycosyltransferase family 4 protein [Anaerolineales bacterium]